MDKSAHKKFKVVLSSTFLLGLKFFRIKNFLRNIYNPIQLRTLLSIMNQLAGKLQGYLSAKRKNASIIVEEFRSISFGAEASKYSFLEVSFVNEKRISNKYVIRMYPDSCETYGVKNEYTIMNRLFKEGFPVPRVILYEEDESILGGPFLIMEYIESKMFQTKVIDANLDQQEYWMKRFAELLVKLHQIDWRKIITDKAAKKTDDPFFSIDAYLPEYITDWEKQGFTLYKSTIDWLKKQRENYPARRIGFNHRDFHSANVIVAEDDSLFLVDWSWSNVADIRLDIANAISTFIMLKQGKLGNLFLEYYEEISGEPIGEITFYEVLTSLQLLFFCICSIENLEKGSEVYKKHKNSFLFCIENLYKFLVERTQIRISEIEELLG